MNRAQRVMAGIVSIGIATFLAGCGINVPSDPDGTLSDVTGGILRVGYSPEPGLIEDREGSPSGPIVDLVDGFANEVNADVAWSLHSEEVIVDMLESDALDLGVGGFTSETPWTDRAGISRGYQHVPGAEDHEIVVLVQLGENAFLAKLETFLDEEAGS